MKKSIIFLLISILGSQMCNAQSTFNSNNHASFSFVQNKPLQNSAVTNSKFATTFSKNSPTKNWAFKSINTSQSQLFNNYLDSTIIKPKWYKTDTGKSLIVAGVLVTTGTIMHFDRSFKVGFRDDINRYLPNFKNTIDDVTQYLPIAAVFALDAVGVQSKHNQIRKLTTLATMTGTSLIVTNALKYSVAEPRPDGSSNNSFPSGHTTTAFMGAHMFHKEYKDRSPFYSIAGYTIASVTGVFRQLNNRHWISDVFAGAGLGIAITEFSYFLNDGWWKEKGINETKIFERMISTSKPSFIAFKTGYASLVKSAVENEPGLSSKNGFRVTAEGAYFFTKNFGIGGEMGFQSFPQEIDSFIQEEFNRAGYELLPQSAGNRMYYAGVYYRIPFGKNSFGAKIHLGAISGPSTKIFARELGQDISDLENPPQQYAYADFEPEASFSWATGLTFKRVLNKSLSIGIYFDYNWADLKFNSTLMDQFNDGAPTYFPKVSRTINYDSYAIGGNLDIMLW